MKSVIQKINAFSSLELASKCFLLFLLLYATRLNSIYLFPVVIAVLLIGFINKSFFTKSYFWILVALLFLPNFIRIYFLKANHFFVMFYVVLIFIIASRYYYSQSKVLQVNAKYLLALMMVLAVVQKFISEQFMSGETIGYLAYTGQLFRLPLLFIADAQEAISQNNTAINKAGLMIGERVNLERPFPFFEEFVTLFTYLTLIAELIFAGLLFIKNKAIKNWFFITFVLLLIITREETGFISLVSILLMMQLGESQSIFRPIYFLLFLISIALIITNWGFL